VSVGRASAHRPAGGLARCRRRLASIAVRVRLPTRRLRLVLAVAAGIAAVLAGAWLWVRDSSLVAVERVTVSGEHGPNAAAIRSALISAARSMTTLDVQMARLRTAISPFPEVKALRVGTQFPHGMRIRVIEQLPVAIVEVVGRHLAVAGDGTILQNVAASTRLPVIPLSVPPGGPRVTDPAAMRAVMLLAAAPYQILSKVAQVTTAPAHGLVAQLRGGPSIYFGDATELRAKWASVVAVLADSGSAGASYIDVTDPMRPAAGAQTAGGASATKSTAGGASTTTPTATSPSGGTTTGYTTDVPTISTTTSTTPSGG
jgi:cell division protein FtsQ